MNGVFYEFSIIKSQLETAFFESATLHRARFARPHELTLLSRANLDSPGILLGIDAFQRFLKVASTQKHRELGNLAIFAPPRSGKSLHLTTQLLTWKGSAIVNDPKGELFDKTSGFRQTLGLGAGEREESVFVFDPEGKGHRFDPLETKETEDELYDAATHLLYNPHEGEGKAFTDRAINMLTQIFIAARLSGVPPFPFVRDLVRLGLFGAAKRLEEISPPLATQFLEIDFERADFEDKFLTSSWGTLSARVRSLLTETVVRSLSASDFCVSDILKGTRPVTVYLRWPERYLLTLKPLIRLIWGALLEELKAEYDKNGGIGCHPILCVVDEAGVSPIPELSKHVATVNGRDISLILAFQSKSQLEENYGKYNAETILNSIDSQIFTRQSNLETAEYLSRLLGYRSGFARSESEHGQESSTSSSEREIPLLTAQDIRELEDGEVIGIHRNLPPFKAKRPDWRGFPELVRRVSLKAPAVPNLHPLRAPLAQTQGFEETPMPQAEAKPQTRIVNPEELLSEARPYSRQPTSW